jgi:hypothetical protein
LELKNEKEQVWNGSLFLLILWKIYGVLFDVEEL